jgi:uncharacterized protein (DUF2236 family)
MDTSHAQKDNVAVSDARTGFGGPVDDGLFGPSSIAWKVVGHPMAFVGGLRSLIIGALHPLIAAGTVEHSDYKGRPVDRLRTTSRYVNATVFGDLTAAREAAELVKRAHRRVKGTDPLTGKPYDAADPEEQLWVHCVAWHSYMASYRAYVGRLTPEQQDLYVAEGVAAAEMIGIPRARVPSSVAELREYWAAMRPQLCVGAYGRELIDFVMRPSFPTELLPFRLPYAVLVKLAVGIIPRDLRSMMGLSQPGPVDAALVATGRSVATAIGRPGARDLMEVLFGKEVRALRQAARAKAKDATRRRVA